MRAAKASLPWHCVVEWCRDEQALLFAGVGIVRDSDPDDEYVETDLKFRPMLDALGVETS